MRNEMYKVQRKNTTLYILNISQNMFVCLEFILLIAIRGFISIYLSLYIARPFTNGNFGITGTSKMVRTPFVSKSSVDVPIRFKFPIAPIVGGVRGPRVYKVLLGGPRNRNILETLI
jgi:hypothetical protein